MSAEQAPPAARRTFFDTNVLVYAHDASDPRKRDVARALLLEHLGAAAHAAGAEVLLTEDAGLLRSVGRPADGLSAEDPFVAPTREY